MANSKLVSITAEYADGRKLVHEVPPNVTSLRVYYDVGPRWNSSPLRMADLDDPACWRELPAPEHYQPCDPATCKHGRVAPDAMDQTIGVYCLDCDLVLAYCWMDNHIPESLSLAELDAETKP
jgi:hypothetical protein